MEPETYRIYLAEHDSAADETLETEK